MDIYNNDYVLTIDPPTSALSTIVCDDCEMVSTYVDYASTAADAAVAAVPFVDAAV